jgi:hypothetical protein
LRKRFLVIESARIIYDEFLALVNREGIGSRITRKVMLFTWMYRDDRLRRFIIERVADANGHWIPARLIDKANSDFFAQWYSGGAKARSNFEYFLVETGIYDDLNQAVHLELDDNWLEDAARVAAQHEPNASLRRRLLENPYKYLVDQRWNALANATSAEMLARSPSANFPTDPDEDNLIRSDPANVSPFIAWNRQKPTSSDKTTTEALVNLVACERANQSHHTIEQALADKIRQLGHEPIYNGHIDMSFTTDAGSVIVEVKSCTQDNVHAQIRKGVSQLLEYRYLYGSRLTAPVSLVLALEVEPGARKRWLAGYL